MRNEISTEMQEKSMDMIEEYKRQANQFLGSFIHNSSLPREEAVLRLGALLFLKKINALAITIDNVAIGEMECVIKRSTSTIDKVLGYNETLVNSNVKGVFKQLLQKQILGCMNDDDPDCLIEMGNFLTYWDADNHDLLIAFTYAIDLAFLEFHTRENGLMRQPGKISKIAALLLNEGAKNVFDPFGGLMDFATTISDRHFVANEINATTWEIGMFRLALVDLLETTEFRCKDSVEWEERQFDAIVTNPPFGTRLNLRSNTPSLVDAEDLPFRNFNSTTNEKGQLITVVPVQFLTSDNPAKLRLREMVTNNNWLDTVIYIPKQKAQRATNIDYAMVVLSKNRAIDKPVRFIDASCCFDDKGNHAVWNEEKVRNLLKQPNGESSISVSKADVINNHSLWLPCYYLFLNSCKQREGFEYIRFADVLEAVPAQRRFFENEGRLVGGMSATVLQYEKKPNDFPLSQDLGNTVKITEPVLFVSMVSAAFPMYCYASESEPVFVKFSRALKAFRVKRNDVHVGYLCVELFRRLVSLQDYISFYPLLSKGVLDRVPLSFPLIDKEGSYLDQQTLFEETRSEHQRAKYKEKEFQDYIAKIKKEYKESIRGRKHAVGQYLSDVSAFWNVLNSFRKEKKGCLMDADMVDEDYQTTVDDLFCAIDTKLNSVLKQMETLLSDENEWEGLDLDEIEPDGFVEEYIKANNDVRFNYVHEGFNIDEYNKALEEMEIEYWAKLLFPVKVLTRVFEDIIKNAVEYGFKDSTRKDYKILISTELIDYNKWEIRIANNGEPAPDRLDPQKVFNLGYTTGLGEGHTGIGAYEVKQLMEMYGGEVEFLSTPDEEYTVTYVLTFINEE